MAVSPLFQQRFSCRSFRPDPVPRATLEQVLEAATWAPNAGNLQPWHFVVVADPDRCAALAAAAWNQHFAAPAPVVVAVCALPERSARLYKDRGRDLYCLQDTAAATQNLLLAATEVGLGSCWVGSFDERAVSRILDLPAHRIPVALVHLGRPAEVPSKRSRRPLEQVVTWA